MPNIKVIDYEESEGRLREIYDGLIASRGKLAGVHKIQSLRPESIVKHMDLYLEIMFSRSELSRAEREMIAVIVSMSNNCEYCQLHHAEALNHYWKNQEKIDQLRVDFLAVDLTPREQALCTFAQQLTKNPGRANDISFTASLNEVGIGDGGVLDAALVVSYFNFVNRMVLGLGVTPGSEEIKGYNY